MKKLLLSLLFTATCFAESIGKDNNEFALALFSKIENSQDNLAFSPYSIFSNLSLLYFGADGNTAEEMQRALHLSNTGKPFFRAFEKLETGLTQNERNGYQFNIANGLFLKQGASLLPTFQEIGTDVFKGTIESVDFENGQQAANTINDWVFEKTRETIPQIVDSADFDDSTQLVTTNAIFFEGKWENRFPPTKTRSSSFYPENKDPIQVDMMKQIGTYSYFSNQEAEGLLLPFRRSSRSQPHIDCLLLLPQNGLQDLEESLTPKTLHYWLASSKPTRVEVEVPKFSFSHQLLLNEPLQSLGMNEAFTHHANFSKITGDKNLSLSKVLHETYFSFYEDGVTAAAATASVIGVTSARPHIEPVTLFKANRPFLFFLIDHHSKAILFMGRVTKPNPSECDES